MRGDVASTVVVLGAVALLQPVQDPLGVTRACVKFGARLVICYLASGRDPGGGAAGH